MAWLVHTIRYSHGSEDNFKAFGDNACNMHLLPDWKGPFNLAHTYISLGLDKIIFVIKITMTKVQ